MICVRSKIVKHIGSTCQFDHLWHIICGFPHIHGSVRRQVEKCHGLSHRCIILHHAVENLCLLCKRCICLSFPAQKCTVKPDPLHTP